MSDPKTADRLPIETPEAGGARGDTRDPLRNDSGEAPVTPKMSGGVNPPADPLATHPDFRDAGEPDEPLEVDDAKSGP